MASTLIMARILVPSDFGLLAMATTFAGAVDGLSQLGLQEALIRRPEDDQRLHDTAFTLQTGRAALTSAVLAISAPAAGGWFNEPRLTPVLWVLAAGAAISGFRNIGIVAFRRQMNYDRQFLLLCLPRLIQVAVTIPLALLWRSYWALLVGIIVSKIAELAFSYLLHPYRPRFSFSGWRELAAFSMWTWAASVASIIWNRCDPIVIGPALGATQLGIYVLASEIACLPVTELLAPAAEVLFAGLSMAQKRGTSPITTAIPISVAMLLIITPVVIAISCASGYIVAVCLGPKWVAAQPVVAIIVWIGLFSPFSFVCGAALISANRVKRSFVVNCLTSLIKLSGLATVVSLTSDLVKITAVGVLIVGVEAVVFLLALRGAGRVSAAASTGGILRIVISIVVTISLVSATGLAWRPVAMPVGQAMVSGALLCFVAMTGFGISVITVWRIAGRPEGPETQIANLIREVADLAWVKISGILNRAGWLAGTHSRVGESPQNPRGRSPQ
jgi:O-antigen/teichoic acid export membrane protein